jgi:U3 small nucleolar RNA-associated protein 13
MSILKQSTDGLSKVWKPFKSHGPFFRGEKCEVSKDTSLLVCLESENITFVDWRSGTIIGKLLDETDDLCEVITCFCLHPLRQEIVVSTKNCMLRHYDVALYLQSGERTSISSNRSFKGHQMPVLCMAYDPSGSLIATGSADRSVRVWDVHGGYCTHR